MSLNTNCEIELVHDLVGGKSLLYEDFSALWIKWCFKWRFSWSETTSTKRVIETPNCVRWGLVLAALRPTHQGALLWNCLPNLMTFWARHSSLQLVWNLPVLYVCVYTCTPRHVCILKTEALNRCLYLPRGLLFGFVASVDRLFVHWCPKRRGGIIRWKGRSCLVGSQGWEGRCWSSWEHALGQPGLDLGELS